MMNMKYVTTCSVFFLLGVFNAVWGQLPQDPRPTEAAIGTARSFTSDGNLTYDGVAQGMRRTLWAFTNTIGGICIDTLDNEIGEIDFQMPDQLPTRLTIDQAQAIAVSWLTQHKVPMTGWSLENRSQTGASDPYTANNVTYMFNWYKRSLEGVRLPCMMDIIMRNDGCMKELYRIERPAEIQTTPKVSLDQAFAAAVQEAGWTSNAILEQADIDIWYDDNDNQVMNWKMVISDITCSKISVDAPPEAAALFLRRPVNVNALTGTVSMGEYLGKGSPPQMSIERSKLINLKNVVLLIKGSEIRKMSKDEAVLVANGSTYKLKPGSKDVRTEGKVITLGRKVSVVKDQYMVQASILDILNKSNSVDIKKTAQKSKK